MKNKEIRDDRKREGKRHKREAERYRVSDGGKRVKRKEDWRKAQKRKWRRKAMEEERGREEKG